MTKLPSNMKQIRLHLARSKQWPEGSSRHGYEFIVPLDANGRIDAEQWKKLREHCRVRRFWAGGPDEIGHVLHRPGGKTGGTWAFHYDIRDADEDPDDDEAGHRFAAHTFVPGEYVSIRDEDGELHTFVVVSVGPVA